MKHFILLAILVIVNCLSAYSLSKDTTNRDSVKIEIIGKIGYGSYCMTELKELNLLKINNQLDFDAKITSNMPSYIYYNAGLVGKWRKYSFGITASYNSTGSRIASSDITGTYRFDMKIHGLSFGALAGVKLFSFYGISGELYTSIGFLNSSLTLKETTHIFHIYQQDKYKSKEEYNSSNFYFEPDFRINLLKTKLLVVGMEFGYLIQFGGEKLSNKDENSWLLDNETIKPQWDGFRSALIITI